MAQLVGGLEAFFDPTEGLDADVRKRRKRALSIEEESCTSPDAIAAWEEAIADIRTREVYGGLVLTPQLGLVPLRVDPDSGYWEFWHVLSGPRPLSNDHPDRVTNWSMRRDSGIVLVLLPGGR